MSVTGSPGVRAGEGGGARARRGRGAQLRAGLAGRAHRAAADRRGAPRLVVAARVRARGPRHAGRELLRLRARCRGCSARTRRRSRPTAASARPTDGSCWRAAGSEDLWVRCCRVLGLDELPERSAVRRQRRARAAPRRADGALRGGARDRARARTGWRARWGPRACPAAEVRDIAQVLDGPQPAALGLRADARARRRGAVPGRRRSRSASTGTRCRTRVPRPRSAPTRGAVLTGVGLERRRRRRARRRRGRRSRRERPRAEAALLARGVLARTVELAGDPRAHRVGGARAPRSSPAGGARTAGASVDDRRHRQRLGARVRTARASAIVLVRAPRHGVPRGCRRTTCASEGGRLVGPGVGDDSVARRRALGGRRRCSPARPGGPCGSSPPWARRGSGNLRGIRGALEDPPGPIGAVLAVEGNYLGRVSARGVGSLRWRVDVSRSGRPRVGGRGGAERGPRGGGHGRRASRRLRRAGRADRRERRHGSAAARRSTRARARRGSSSTCGPTTPRRSPRWRRSARRHRSARRTRRCRGRDRGARTPARRRASTPTTRSSWRRPRRWSDAGIAAGARRDQHGRERRPRARDPGDRARRHHGRRRAHPRGVDRHRADRRRPGGARGDRRRGSRRPRDERRSRSGVVLQGAYEPPRVRARWWARSTSSASSTCGSRTRRCTPATPTPTSRSPRRRSSRLTAGHRGDEPAHAPPGDHGGRGRHGRRDLRGPDDPGDRRRRPAAAGARAEAELGRLAARLDRRDPRAVERASTSTSRTPAFRCATRTCGSRRAPDIPVYISASGPRTLELAGEIADGVILLVGLFPEALAWALEHVDRGAARRGPAASAHRGLRLRGDRRRRGRGARRRRGRSPPGSRRPPA